MDILQCCSVRTLALCFKIFDLSANHSVNGASAPSYLFNDFYAIFRGALQPRQDFIRLRLKRVAGKDRQGFPKDDVAGWLAAAEIVIVERRQIVMNERLCMQHFQCAAQFFHAFRQASGDHARGLKAQNRTKPFASGKNTVSHGLMDGVRPLCSGGQKLFQRSVNGALALRKNLIQHEY
jgi:hypothetical protein